MGKIAKLLERELFSVNCNSCHYLIQNEYRKMCQECLSYWSISKERALELEKAIMEIMEEE